MYIQPEKQILNSDIAYSISDGLRKQIKGGEVSEGGAIFKPKGKELSIADQSNTSGAGIGIILSETCNRKCHFCPQNREPIKDDNLPYYQDKAPSTDNVWSLDDLPPSIENLKRYAAIDPHFHDSIKNNIKAITFSGGEPFLMLEETIGNFGPSQGNNPGIYEWMDSINNMEWKEELYFSILTSGDFITEDNITKLVDKGMNEIRINLAASDYDLSPEMIKKLEIVRTKVDKLSVEVPVMGWQLNKLIGSLKRLEDIGVDYLQLHQLNLSDFNAPYLTSLGLLNYTLIYSTGDDKTDLGMWFYLPSLIDIYTVIRYIDDNNIDLIWNECSSRVLQLHNLSREYLRLKFMHRGSEEKNIEIGTWEEYKKRITDMKRF